MRRTPRRPVPGVLAGLMAALALMAMPLPLAAHTDRAITPHDLRWVWMDTNPLAVIALWTVDGIYWRGIIQLWGSAPGRGIRRWQARAFAAGGLALVAAMLTPIDALGGVLFSAHMVQHELIIVLAAPLLVLGRPLILRSATWSNKLWHRARPPLPRAS